MSGLVLSIAGTIGGLILVYLLLAHPNALVAEANAVSGFVTGESKILQGR